MSETGCLNPSRGKYANFQVDTLTVTDSFSSGAVKQVTRSATTTLNAADLYTGPGAVFPVIVQPAGTFIKDVVFIPNMDITTAAHELSFDIRQAATGQPRTGGASTAIVAQTQLINNAPETWSADVKLNVIKNAHGRTADVFANATGGPLGGPDNTEAIVMASAVYSALDREVSAELGGNGGVLNAAVVGAIITCNIVFQYV
jgi:hypothetical protein